MKDSVDSEQRHRYGVDPLFAQYKVAVGVEMKNKVRIARSLSAFVCRRERDVEGDFCGVTASPQG